MKEDTLYARAHNCSISSISAERSTKDRNTYGSQFPLRNLSESAKRLKNSQATRKGSRQDNTPQRKDKYA